mmetsp:Transcript_16439/g.35771  ORF Transcript_16439/g.35771 Transcript_16439/m.35771 type:complete len:106 (-) Transcript_16439:319-636(-)
MSTSMKASVLASRHARRLNPLRSFASTASPSGSIVFHLTSMDRDENRMNTSTNNSSSSNNNNNTQRRNGGRNDWAVAFCKGLLGTSRFGTRQCRCHRNRGLAVSP